MNKLILSVALALLAVMPLGAQELAGQAVMVVGQAVATDANGAERRLRKGDSIFSGETISTARHSYVNVLYSDEGRTLIGPNSQLRIDEYNYSPETPAGGPRAKGGASSSGLETAGRSVLTLLKGGFRAVTGLIGKTNRENYAVKTRVATIGIRGTDFIVVQCDEQCSDMGPVPEGTDPQGGSVIGVYEHRIGVSNVEGKGVELGENEFLLVTRDGEFIALQVVPEFLLLSPLQDPAQCD